MDMVFNKAMICLIQMTHSLITLALNTFGLSVKRVQIISGAISCILKVELIKKIYKLS